MVGSGRLGDQAAEADAQHMSLADAGVVEDGHHVAGQLCHVERSDAGSLTPLPASIVVEQQAKRGCKLGRMGRQPS
jgi:hypothetical protein